MPNLRRRNLQPELMDDPDLDAGSHRHALAGLRRLNWASSSVRILWPSLRRIARESARPIRILDLASGGGDVATGISRRAQRAGLPHEILGLDVSPTAVGYARERARSMHAQIKFDTCDVLTSDLPGGYDVVMCSLFLHHLSTANAVKLLFKMARSASRAVLANDLRRSAAGYWLAQAACRCLTRSPIVHVDGPRSVAAAFTIPEANQLCLAAGLRNYQITPRWPFRFLLESQV